MKWALIGASDIAATQVVPAMRQLGHEVVGVMSSNSEWGGAYAAQHGIPRSTNSLDEIADWDVDAVYVSTTNQLHAEQAIWAANAGLNVLCEKPLALSFADAAAMVDAAAVNGVVLATNHHLRANSALHTARALLASGDLGELRAIRVNFAGSLPERLRGWRISDPTCGAGVILDLTVHIADTIRFLTSQEIDYVTAVALSQALGQGVIEDTCLCIFELSGGAAVTTYESFSAPHSYSAVEIHGTKASLYLSDVLTQEQRGEIIIRRDGVETPVNVPAAENLYVATIKAFESAIAGSGTPLSSGADGRASLAVALSAARSAAEGRRISVADISSP